MKGTKTKSFDCVKMKHRIQAKLARKHRGMTDEEVTAAIQHELATSDDPIARFWRSLKPEHEGGTDEGR